MTYFERINFIATACADNGIAHSVNTVWDGYQIRFPWCEGDVACHFGTYGHDSDMVESYQFPWDEGDVSVLTPEEAVEHIINYYAEFGD